MYIFKDKKIKCPNIIFNEQCGRRLKFYNLLKYILKKKITCNIIYYRYVTISTYCVDIVTCTYEHYCFLRSTRIDYDK